MEFRKSELMMLLRSMNGRKRSRSILTTTLVCLLAASKAFGWSHWHTGGTLLKGNVFLAGERIIRRMQRINRRRSVICFDNEIWGAHASSGFSSSHVATVKAAPTPPQARQSTPPQQSITYRRSSGWVGTDQLNQIKEEVDMISFIKAFGLDQFKRTGTNRATACCPFHDDRNPSLGIDGDRGFYKCFSCGAAGDVFRFVRQYHKQKQGEELPFMDAVRVVHDFKSGSLPGGHIELGSSIVTSNTVAGSGSSLQRMSEEERKQLAEKCERIYAMNQEAAAFYAHCLTLPFSGGARHYLRSRGFKSAATARDFALGYAPDVYFGINRRYFPREQKSLVRHFRDKGYTASEILESGLAVRTKQASKSRTSNEAYPEDAESGAESRSHGNATSTADDDLDHSSFDHSSLMDRFRGRLIVPIMDRTGAKVLAFGGRTLPLPDTNDAADHHQKSDFKAPKYLNSPETPVFQKKHILYGHHIVMEQFQRSRTTPSFRSPSGSNDPLIVVEGYMDVLALWDAGIKSAVATMGTAISMEQVNAAAKLTGANGGRVVICMDSDDAGLAAVERLCTGNFFTNAAKTYGVQFLVASLPSGLKDPSDYIELRRTQENSEHVADQFRKEVIDTAIDWSDWYLARILDRYDENANREAAGSFGDVFQRVSNFLAGFSNPAERTKGAYDVAGRLAKIMATYNNSTTISKAARVQLESDLIDSASRIANAKESMKRRVELVSGGSARESRSLLSAMSRGGISPDGTDEIDKLSRKARGEWLRPPKTNRVENKSNAKRDVNQRDGREYVGPTRGRARTQQRIHRPTRTAEMKQPPSLTPHFAGFEFEYQSDADWLGVPRNKGKRDLSVLTLGTKYYDDPDNMDRNEKNKPIYFFSNDFHGHRFISKEAVHAGYSDKMPVTDLSSIVDKGVGSLFRQDIDATIAAAEHVLLHSLVQHYPDSRNAVRDVMQTSASVGPDLSIEWSSSDRQWLFHCLIDEDVLESVDATMCDPLALRALLVNRKDVPSSAFQESASSSGFTSTGEARGAGLFSAEPTNGRVQNVASSPDGSTNEVEGTLDIFFAQELNLPGGTMPIPNNDTTALFAQREKASLAAQEHLMTLLSASAAKQIEMLQEDTKAVSGYLQSISSSTFPLKTEDANLPDRVMPSAPFLSDTNTSTSPFLDLTFSSRDLSVSNSNLIRFQNISLEEVHSYYQNCLSGLREILDRRQTLDQSTRRITERLMRFSSGTLSETVEGRISVTLQKRIAKRLDEHLVELEANQTARGDLLSSAEVDEDGRLGVRDDVDGSLEDELAKIESSWGDWCKEDYVWSPSDANVKAKKGGLQHARRAHEDLDEEDDDETLEEALQRIETAWSKWESD